MIKQILSLILRKLNLIEPFDYLRFMISKFQNREDNKNFKNEFPDVALPLDFLLYESFGRLNYRRYYLRGRDSASSFINVFQKYISLSDAKVFEWGCGPGRVIRHFPELLYETITNFSEQIIIKRRLNGIKRI